MNVCLKIIFRINCKMNGNIFLLDLILSRMYGYNFFLLDYFDDVFC